MGDEVTKILQMLRKEYGPRKWRPGADPITTLIATVLSQNTSDINSHRAFDALVSRFGSWESIAAADARELASTIRAGGLAEVKASRIKQILRQIRERQGSLDLSFLNDLSLAEAKMWLQQLPGVGPKTAGCVLLFSLGRPAMPVDTHVYRVAKRLGLIDGKVSVARAHEILEDLVQPNEVYEFHMLMVEHGRRVCKALRPKCHLCALRTICPGESAFREEKCWSPH